MISWLFQAAKTGRIKSLAQAIREFFKRNNRMPSTRERNDMGSILQDVTGKSNVLEFPKDRITNPFQPRPGDVKKMDESPLSTLLDRQYKEIEGIDTKQGMGFYDEMGDVMKKHRREELELKYDEMYNRILEKAKRIESDPKVLLEAELGKKLTGEETTTQLLDLFKNRPKKASGGIARVGMFKGGSIWKEFIEKLFIKSSNDIRSGKGKWAGLTQPQWIKQHDDLTKMLKKWEQGGKKGLPEGASEYLGMNDLQISRAIKEAEKKVKKPKVKDEYYSKKDMEKEWAHENKLAKQEMKQEDQMIDKALSGMDERTLIKTKYPGISDDLLNKILIDDNPQRKADVMATMDEYLKLREIGKSEAEAYDIITKSFSKTPTKHASGGIAGELHLNEGGRVPMIFGGSAGLKGLIALIKAGINKSRKTKIKTLFPKYSADEKNYLD